MAQVKVQYALSDKGQRAALVAGLPAQEYQGVVVETDDPRFLALVSVDKEGQASLVLSTEVDTETTLYDWTLAEGKTASGQCVSVRANYQYQSWYGHSSIGVVDHLLTPEEVVPLVLGRRAAAAALTESVKTARQAAFESAQAEAQAQLPAAIRKAEEKAEARAAGEAAQAERERIEAAQALAKQAQRAEWVATRGTPNQQARLAAGLLPVSEVEEEMAEEAFKELASFSPYEPMQARDVCNCEYDEACHVDFSSEESDEATAEEWERLEAIRAALPGAEYQLRVHVGESKHCEQTVTRKGVKVTVLVGAYRFHREYAV